MSSQKSVNSSVGKAPKKLVNRAKMAELISAEVFDVSPRSLENWRDLPYKLVNGQALHDPDVGLEVARRRVAEAPLYRGGRRRAVA